MVVKVISITTPGINDIQIEVGWGYISGNDLVTVNFHMKFNDLQWKEVINLDKLSLFNNLQFVINNKQFEFPISNITEKNAITNKLLETKFVRNHIVELEYYRLKIEYWISYILQFLNELDIEVQNFIKEHWFNSQIEVMNIYQNMIIHEKISKTSLIINNDHINKTKKNLLFPNFFHRKETNNENDYQGHDLTEIALTNSNQHQPQHLVKNQKGDQKSLLDIPVSYYSQLKKKYAHSINSDSHTPFKHLDNELESEKTTKKSNALILRIEVTKGQKIKANLHVYNVYLRVSGKDIKDPLVHRIFQRYSTFKQLYLRLLDINADSISTVDQSSRSYDNPNQKLSSNPSHKHSQKNNSHSNFMELITSTFPGAPLKSMIGLPLNKEELIIRTAALDRWFREVCYHYRQMPSKARIAIREFLNFDLSSSKDITILDQLSWGLIDYTHISKSNSLHRSKNLDPDNSIVIVRNTGLYHMNYSSQLLLEDSTGTSSQYTPSEIDGLSSSSGVSRTTGGISKITSVSASPARTHS